MTPYNNKYVVVLARSLDFFASAIVTRDYGITISSWCGLELRKGPGAHRWAKVLGAFLNWLEEDHCDKSIKADLFRANYVIKVLS